MLSVQQLFNEVQIEINTSCSRRCSCCPNSIFDRSLIQNEKLISVELFHKIIDELAEIGFSGIISPHFFGEPLLDKRLVDLMDYVRKRLPRAEIVVYTNGDYLTFEKYMELVRVGVDVLFVTQHDRTMPAGIKDLYSQFESSGSLPVHLSYQVFDESTSLFNTGGLVDVSIRRPLPDCLLRPNFVIDYEGNVKLCCMDYLGSITLGNVKDNKLLDIWFSECFRNIRKDLLKMDFRLPICKRCVENLDPAEMKRMYMSARIHYRETPGEETFLYDPIELEKLTKTPDATEFRVEMIKSDRYKEKSEPVLLIEGWAIDSSAGSPAAAVFITFDTGQEFRAYYPFSRPDVAVHFRNEGLQDSGFVAIVRSCDLPPGKRTFRLKIVTHDRIGYYYPCEEFSFENTPEQLQSMTTQNKQKLDPVLIIGRWAFDRNGEISVHGKG